MKKDQIFKDAMILGGKHSVILPNVIPLQSQPQEVLVSFISEREITNGEIASFGLWGSASNDFNKFYPDLKVEDLQPKEEDFIEPVYRLLSNCIVAKNRLPTEFPANVLKESMQLLVGQSVYPDHDDDVVNAVGAVKSVFWEEQRTQDGVLIPAGINGILKIDAKSNPRVARGIMMDPPSIHSNSVTVVFAWKPSHEFENIYDFYNKLGQLHADGTMVRRIVTKIESYLETSLVSHGADPYAQIIKNGKLNNAIYANRRYHGISQNKENNNEVNLNEVQERVSYIDFKNLSKLSASETTISLSDEFQNHNTTETIDVKTNNQNYNNMKLIELLTPLILALGLQVDALSMKEDDEQSIKQGIQKLIEKINLSSTNFKELERKYNSMKEVIELKDVKTIVEIGKQHLADVREQTLTSYKKLFDDESKQDPNIIALISNESTGLQTLVSLKASYEQSLEEKFPLHCSKCNSTEITRTSSVVDTQENREVPKTVEDVVKGIVDKKF